MFRSFSVLTVLLFSLSVFADGFDSSRMTWLTGHWKGDGFGGTSEEIWSPAEGGVVMGMFRHHSAGVSLNFYEFLTINENGLHLKHFHPDMTSWEEKNDVVSFPFLSQTDDRVEFDGMIYERLNDDEMRITLNIRQGDVVNTEVFTMRRVTRHLP